jgi:hypothetical protein
VPGLARDEVAPYLQHLLTPEPPLADIPPLPASELQATVMAIALKIAAHELVLEVFMI